ncbi:MAG: hypothetical protein RJA99_3359 [Pseudomonadota bacterium]
MSRSRAGRAHRERPPFEAPHAGTEVEVARIWTSVLRLQDVGRMDNFFALGGHSLQATQVLAKVRDVLGKELPLAALFDAPVLVDFAAKVDRHATTSASAIAVLSREGKLPLSHAQQRLWFLHQYEAARASYNIVARLNVTGAGVSAEALSRVLRRLVERHEPLRTAFRTSDGVAFQEVRPASMVPVQFVDLSEVSMPEAERRAAACLQQDAATPFDLSSGLMLRAVLVRLGASRHVMQLTLHHIASDGWSMGVVVREVAQIYSAQLAGESDALPPLPVQYVDYAAWQRERLSGALLETHLAFWRRQLEGVPARLELPTDRPRPVHQTFAGASVDFRIAPPLSERLRELAEDHGATLFMVLQAAFAVLLHRYSGQCDICIGTPVAGRPRAELEGLVGCFVNTLALRYRIEPALTFVAFLEAAKSTVLEAFAHQELPFEKLVEELRPVRNLSHSPYFQVLFALQNAPRHKLEIPGIAFDSVPLASQTANFDITCSLTESDEGLEGRLEYNTDLFDDGTIGRFARHYEELLKSISEDPETTLQNLRLLSAQEEQQILVEWNSTQFDYPRDTPVHQLFEKQVQRDPGAVAVVYEGVHLTYGDLDERANQLARHLRSLGVSADVLVGLCLERSLDLLVGLLATLKAGGAYVPLDPSYPAERLKYMLLDSSPKVLLTQERLFAQLPPSEATVLCVDRDWPVVAGHRKDDLENLVGPDNLAYVIYTSGSTGRPKGVAVRHGGLANFLHSMRCEPGLCRDDAVVCLTSLSFDIAALELYLPLIVGARVVLAGSALAQDPQRLCRLLEQHQVTLVQATPSTWHLLMEVGWSPDRPVKVLCGGEALPVSLMRRLAERFGGVWNMYGPTETTVWSSLAFLNSDAGVPTIGRPIANTRLYVLDRQMSPVPVGVAGELYIGGDGLARGYLNRPELSAERFVADPFGAAGGRLYRSGDLARFRADGSVEYLGRIDDQVKLRGFRIELGEIESLLEAQPSVERAAVLLREDTPGDKRLVAYLVARGEPPDRDTLSAAISRQLPAYMVPHTYVVLAALPMTPNGKLDRRALPAPDDRRRERRANMEPCTPLEVMLAGLWRRILRLDVIGRHDDFFELGGHSLLVLQLSARITEETGREVPMTELFRCSTLVEQAALLESAPHADERGEGVIALEDADHLLTAGQRRLWLFQQMFPNSCAYHMSGTINTPTGVMLNAARLREVVTILHSRHDALRLVFRQVNGEPRQRLHRDMALELAFCETSDEAEFESRAAAFLRQPFDLSQGPLFRILCASLPAGQRIFWVIHHIVADGVSLRILADELKSLLEGGAAAADAAMPRQHGFLDFVREQANAGRSDAARAYWMDKYGSLPPRVELPYDFSSEISTDGALAAFSVSAPVEVLGAMRDLCVEERVTPFTVLYAAFVVLLHKITGAVDLVVGVPFAGRSNPKMRNAVGFFVNTAAMRTEIARDASFRALVRQGKTDLFQAYRHQDYPFDKMVEDIGVPVEAGRFPLTSVFLNMLTLSSSETELMRLQEGHRIVRGDAKFDMDWYLLKREDTLLVDCHYRSALFLPETVEFVVRAYLELLHQLSKGADAPLGAFSLRAEFPSVVSTAVAPGDPEGMPRSVVDAFTRIAALSPGAMAIRHGASTLTYAELDARRIALAASLREAGVTAGVLVALLYMPSEDMVVAILAALTVGATYVPLDPYHPEVRLEAICADCTPALLLAGEDCRSLAEQLAAATRIPLHGASCGQVTRSPAIAPCSVVDRTGGYILYTSGSTGRPKGVLQSERNVLLHARAYISSLGLDTRDNLLLLASYAFDASVMDIFGALLSGATLTIADPRAATPESLRRLVDAASVTVLHATPTMFRHVMGDSEGSVLAGLRWVVLGGEAATARDMQLFEACTSPTCRLVNGLGPTECTVALQFHTGHGARVVQPMSAGFPVQGVEAILEGENDTPLAFHAGEITLRSDALAFGYWGMPEETAAAFSTDAAGRRCYKTGDVGRRWIDGSIRPLGRRDQQLKVRGVRIEAMEVEHAIRSVPGIAESICRGESSADGTLELVAYCKWDPDKKPDYSAVRNFVARTLPSAMWPSRYCTLDRVEVTTTGKIDRAHIHLGVRPEEALQAEAPDQSMTRMESLVCKTVGDILRKVGVAPADNFFALGGNSLQALRLIASVSHDLGVEIPLHELFGAVTLRDVALVIERQLLLRGLMEQSAPAGDVETLRF